MFPGLPAAWGVGPTEQAERETRVLGGYLLRRRRPVGAEPLRQRGAHCRNGPARVARMGGGQCAVADGSIDLLVEQVLDLVAGDGDG